MEKKNSNKHSMDGFVRRNAPTSRQLGQPSLVPLVAGGMPTSMPPSASKLEGATVLESNTQAPVAAVPGKGIRRGDLDDSLKAIDADRKKKINKHDPYRKAHKRKLIKRIVIILFVLAALAGIAYGVMALIAVGKVVKGNIFEAITEQGTPLQADANGRSNILIFGTSEDDPGHDGANLTDSILVLSIDQKAKTAQMLSVPRDLWVNYDDSCSLGTGGKINSVYECGLLNNKNNADSAAKSFMSKVDEVLGIKLQYYAHLNYTVVKDSVNAVGGVDLNIVGDGSPGIYDTNFDWDCPNGAYTCKNVYYPTNGNYHLNGTQALFLARARADTGRYSYKDFGLARGDFDRQANQRKILTALVAKAKSAGTLANPITTLNLINSLGNNIKTNFETKEISTLVSVGKSIDISKLTSLDLADANNPLVTTGTGPDGSSIVKPVAGLTDYSDIQTYVKAAFSGDTSALENASVGVYNGSDSKGVATSTATTLTNAGFDVVTIDDTTTAYTPKYTLYDLSNGKKPSTLAKLEKQLGVKVTAGTPPGITSTNDFVVVVGNGIASSSTNSQ